MSKKTKISKQLDNLPVGNYNALLPIKKNDLSTEALPNRDRNRDRSVTESLPEENKTPEYHLMSLSPTENEVFSCLYGLCKENGTRKISEAFTSFLLENITLSSANKLKASYLRKILNRLKNKGCIKVVNIKNGRFSIREIELVEEIYHKFEIKRDRNRDNSCLVGPVGRLRPFVAI